MPTNRNVDRVSLVLADVIDRARRERGWTQTRLAARMGRSSAGHLSELLDGRTARTASYATILDALGYELVVAVRPKPS